jgi:hypothetical protein
MFEELLSEFEGSEHGQNALNALVAKGFSGDDAQKVISEALPAAREAMEGSVQDHPQPEVGLFNLFGGHAGKEFLIGLTEGIVRGDGFKGSLEDGGISLIAGHIGEVIGPKLNLSADVAGDAAAAVAPFVVRFAHEKLASRL